MPVGWAWGSANAAHVHPQLGVRPWLSRGRSLGDLTRRLELSGRQVAESVPAHTLAPASDHPSIAEPGHICPQDPSSPSCPTKVGSCYRPRVGRGRPCRRLWSLSRKEGSPTPAGPDRLRPRSRQRPGRLAPIQPTLCTCPETLRWDQTSEGLEHPSHASWRPVQSRVPSISRGLLCHETVTAPSTATPSNSAQATGVGPVSWVFPSAIPVGIPALT